MSHIVLFIVCVAMTFLGAMSAAETATQQTARWIHFKEWQPVNLATSYFSAYFEKDAKSDKRLNLWFDANFRGVNSVIQLRGQNPGKLNRVPPAFDAKIIRDYDQDLGGIEFPIISRSSATQLRDGTLVVLAAIGPAYQGGNSELFPAIFIKRPDDAQWKHLGAPAGEPCKWLAEIRQQSKKIRSDGGSIIELADGRLRMYTQAYGVRLSIAEADNIAGPWTFSRDESGAIKDHCKDLPGGAWLFPQVVQIGDKGYVLTGADAWPPRQLWGAISSDGLTFRIPTEQDQQLPLLRPTDINSNLRSFKALRFAYDETANRLIAIVNPWNAQTRSYPLLWTDASIDLDLFKEP